MNKYSIRVLTNVYDVPVGFEVREANAPRDTMEHCLLTTKDRTEAEQWVARQLRHEAAAK